MNVSECRKLKVNDKFFQKVIEQAVNEYFLCLRDSKNVPALEEKLIATCTKAKSAAEAQPVKLAITSEFGVRTVVEKNPVWEAEEITKLLNRGFQYTDENVRPKTSLDEQFWKIDA